jgi:hypothetical protein
MAQANATVSLTTTRRSTRHSLRISPAAARPGGRGLAAGLPGRIRRTGGTCASPWGRGAPRHRAHTPAVALAAVATLDGPLQSCARVPVTVSARRPTQA